MALERSPELEQLYRDMEDAYRRKDAEAIREMLSTHEATVSRGTAPDEVARGRDEITRLVIESVEFAPELRAASVEAYADGGVGFIYAETAFVMEDGREMPTRMMAVTQREDGKWRMVNSIASLPVPNEMLEGDSPLLRSAART